MAFQKQPQSNMTDQKSDIEIEVGEVSRVSQATNSNKSSDPQARKTVVTDDGDGSQQKQRKRGSITRGSIVYTGRDLDMVTEYLDRVSSGMLLFFFCPNMYSPHCQL